MGIYFAISLLEAGCLGEASNWCNGLALMEYTLRSLIMLSTVVAINFNITHIRFCIQVGSWAAQFSLCVFLVALSLLSINSFYSGKIIACDNSSNTSWGSN